MNKEKAFQNLKDTVESIENLNYWNCKYDVPENYNLRYFMIDGTLLGYIRENDFIGHDTDLDLGVYMEQWTPEIFGNFTTSMLEKGFIPYHSFGIFGQHFETSFYRNGIKIDLFFYYKSGDKRRFNAFLNGGRTLPNDILTYEYDAHLIENLKEIEWKGHKFMIPADPEKVLVAKYGENWREPVVNWDWARMPKNLISEGKYL